MSINLMTYYYFGGIYDKNKRKKLEGMTFIDLFAGLGGFRLALESLGASCVYSNEWDKYAQQVVLRLKSSKSMLKVKVKSIE